MTLAIAKQDPAELIDRAIADNRLAHALLIHGQNLSQVEGFAYQLAGKLMQIDASDDLEASLIKHPDIFTIRPSKKSRIISVDDMRELIRNVQHSPQQGLRKVAFIFEVDRLNNNAANAFLKTLEEPPLNTNLLLLTTRPHSLLATIRSRCQLFRLPTSALEFDDEQALAWLESYKEWLGDIVDGKPGGKQSVPHYVVGLYALVERFSNVVNELTKTVWKEQSAHLPEDMDDNERIALESRISISIRQDFLAAIESTTEDFARQIMDQAQDPSGKLVESVKALESANSLLRLNMKAETMLESYLLQALRIWSAK